MRMLILGHSSIARKRVIPAIGSLSEITDLEIASRTDPAARFDDYDQALTESTADLVYISVVNSQHGHWVRRALESGRHVIVDKPAFLSFAEAEQLVELSRSRDLCLAEATVYTRHPQIEALQALFARVEAEPVSLHAIFSFPALGDGDFRYQQDLGGGALHDLAPYAVTPGRIFWHVLPESVDCRVVTTDGPEGVDTSFHVALLYPGGRSLVGYFGFTTAYRNHLSVLGPESCVDVDRIFTTPVGQGNELTVRGPNGSSRIKTPAADSFALFLREVVESIGTGRIERLRKDLLDDAFVRDWMRRSAGRN